MTDDGTTTLWYEAPAAEWTEALPVGNGRLGAMVHGRPGEERLQLNEETLWAGDGRRYQNPDALEHLAEVRELLFEGRHAAAEALAEETMLGEPTQLRPYQPVGDLLIDFEAGADDSDDGSGDGAGHGPTAGAYRRELDLSTAVARAEYEREPAGDGTAGEETAGGGATGGGTAEGEPAGGGTSGDGTATGETRGDETAGDGTSDREPTAEGGTAFVQSCFVSAPDDVLVYRVAADEPGSVDAALSLDREQDARARAVGDELVLRGAVVDLPGDPDEHRHRSEGGWGLAFEARARVRVEGADAALAAEGDRLRVTGADAFTVVLAAATSYDGRRLAEADGAGPWGEEGADPAAACTGRLDAVADRSFEALREAHVAEHAERFDRVSLDLGEAVEAPTDERLRRVREGRSDPDLVALYVQYGRYLLLASSRPDSRLPANLQGIWNQWVDPPWNCGFTTNVNLEMNYWPAEVANLPECAEPLFRFLDRLREDGRRTAAEHYDCEGFVVHHNADLWGNTVPVDGAEYGLWPTGAAWLSRALWEHYRFAGDGPTASGSPEAFLAERAYPIVREAAQFLLEFLVEHPGEGWLVTAPSLSPENRFVSPSSAEADDGTVGVDGQSSEEAGTGSADSEEAGGDGESGDDAESDGGDAESDGDDDDGDHAAAEGDAETAAVCAGPTMDVQLVTDLFEACVEAAEVLDRDGELAAELAGAVDRLPPMQVGAGGRLQEWLADYDAVDPGHRHVSHLYWLYPGEGITLRGEPELAEAARRSLEHRLDHGGGNTGWSCAWTIGLFARLEDGERAREQVRTLLAESTYDDLLDAHPPFQIDGNFGGTAGVLELLLGSHRGELRPLPALPDAWSDGSVEGLRARGGHEVDLAWSDGSLDEATIRAGRDGECRVRAGDATVDRVETASGRAVDLDRRDDGSISFSADAGEIYRVLARSIR